MLNYVVAVFLEECEEGDGRGGGRNGEELRNEFFVGLFLFCSPVYIEVIFPTLFCLY